MPNEILPNRTGRLHPSSGRDTEAAAAAKLLVTGQESPKRRRTEEEEEEEEELAPSPKLRGHVGLHDLMSRHGNQTKKDKLLVARGKVSAP